MSGYDPWTAWLYAAFAIGSVGGAITAQAPWLLTGWVLMGAADLTMAYLLWPGAFALWFMANACAVGQVIKWLNDKGGPPGGSA